MELEYWSSPLLMGLRSGHRVLHRGWECCAPPSQGLGSHHVWAINRHPVPGSWYSAPRGEGLLASKDRTRLGKVHGAEGRASRGENRDNEKPPAASTTLRLHTVLPHLEVERLHGCADRADSVTAHRPIQAHDNVNDRWLVLSSVFEKARQQWRSGKKSG